jgi:hypothetical protein
VGSRVSIVTCVIVLLLEVVAEKCGRSHNLVAPSLVVAA